LRTLAASRFNAAKADFRAAWEALKASTPPSLLAAAYKAMNCGIAFHIRALCEVQGWKSHDWISVCDRA
jgi:hypothetical protein